MTYPRRGPSRRDKWKLAVLKTNTLSHGTRLFLVHTLAKNMAADGFVCRPKEKLAGQAHLSERQVQRYISNAVALGWLVLTNRPSRGVVPEYQATFPNRKRETQNVSLYIVQKGDVNKPPLGGTKASPFSRGKTDTAKRKVVRPYKGSRAHVRTPPQSEPLASSLRLSSQTRQKQNRTDGLRPRHLGSLQPERCSTPSGATRLSGLEFCKGDSRMRSVSAWSKSKSATKGAGHE